MKAWKFLGINKTITVWLKSVCMPGEVSPLPLMSLTHTKPNLLKSKNPKLIFAAQLYRHMKTWEILKVSSHVQQDLQTANSTFKEREFKVCPQWYLDLFYTTHAQLNHKFTAEFVPLLPLTKQHILSMYLWDTYKIGWVISVIKEEKLLWKRKKHVRQNPSRLNKHYCVYIIIYISLARKARWICKITLRPCCWRVQNI